MKKYISVLVIIFLINPAIKAQDSSYVIDGTLEKIKSGTIYLNIYEGEKTIKDSAIIKNGIFKFTGFVPAPFFATLTMPSRSGDYYAFYIEPVLMSISGRADSLKLLTIKGSTVNDDNRMLKDRMKTISLWEAANSQLYEQAYRNKNKRIMDSLDQVDLNVLTEKRRVVAAFIKLNPGSMRGAMAITENFSYYAESSDVAPLYDLLEEKIKRSSKGKEIKKLMEVYSRVAPGKEAPDIIQRTPDSTLLSLSSLRGKYVLVDFWASWCGPCRRENPNIAAAYERFKDKGFSIFGVSYDTRKENWLLAIKEDHLDWYQVSDLQGWGNSTSAQYGIRAIPSNVLLDKNGIIIAKNIFGKKLIEKLNELLPGT